MMQEIEERVRLTNECAARLGISRLGIACTPDNVVSLMMGEEGTRFAHQGRVPETGLDCLGLVAWALLQTNWVAENPTNTLRVNYPRLPRPRDLEEIMLDECYEVTNGPLLPGDLLTFGWSRETGMRHVATVQFVYPWRGIDMVHAHPSIGRVVVQPLSDEWMATLRGAYRLKCWA